MDSSISRAFGDAKNAVLDHRRRRAHSQQQQSPSLEASPGNRRRASTTTTAPSRRSSTAAPLRFHRAMEALSVTEAEMHELLETEGGLDALKQSLKSRGAVTNNLIKQGIHVYMAENRANLNSSSSMDGSRMNDSRRALNMMDHSNSSRSSMSDDSLLLRDFSR